MKLPAKIFLCKRFSAFNRQIKLIIVIEKKIRLVNLIRSYAVEYRFFKTAEFRKGKRRVPQRYILKLCETLRELCETLRFKKKQISTA